MDQSFQDFDESPNNYFDNSMNYMNNSWQETPHLGMRGSSASETPMAIPRETLLPKIELSTTELSTPTPEASNGVRPQRVQDLSSASVQPGVKSEDRDTSSLYVGNNEPAQSIVENSLGNENPSQLLSHFLPDAPDTNRIPSTASLARRPDSSSAPSSSARPIINTPSLFGGSIHAISAPSIFGGSIQNTSTSKLARQLANNPPMKSPTQVISGPDDDSDDDLMIINPENASPEAQFKWNSQPVSCPRAPQNGDVLFVKQEPRDEVLPNPTSIPIPPRVPPPPKRKVDNAKLLAAQRAMLERGRARPSNSEGSSRPFIHRPDQSPSLNSDRFEDNTFPSFGNDTDQMDAAMRDTQEDYSWMDEEDEVDEEFQNMVRLRDLLMKKERSGRMTKEESMELFKVKKRIETKERLRAAASRYENSDEEESLFLPPEPREDTVRRHRKNRPRNQPEDEDSNFGGDNAGNESDEDMIPHMMADEFGGNSNSQEQADLGFTKSGKPRKRRAKVAKDARQAFQRQEDQRREKERTKAQKKKARQPVVTASRRKPVPAAKGRGKGKGKEKAATRKSAKAKGKEKAVVKNGTSLLRGGNSRAFNGVDPVGQMILDDLMNNDPIQDRLQDPIFNRAPEVTISGPQTKTTQFQLLFANIPELEDPITRGAVKSDKAKLREASKSFGYAKCKAQDGKWLIKGMKSTLYHHQLLGAQWMVQRELSSQPPHGGLLADSMGLGKTVQTLACMVGNPPGPEDIERKVRATLIVVPATVIEQWIDEIRNHVDKKIFPKVFHYKTSSGVDLEILQDVDIVVTSYNEVMKQFPFPDKEGRIEIARSGYKAWWKRAMENMGLLHQVNWYRVVLDEAQAIKNNSARTSLACQNLKSVYRWCLTGTPLLNRLEELFPYLRFLKANYSMDWQIFQKYFCDPSANDCYNRISTLLSYTMMRRTMKTTILNRPIITLPKPHPSIIYIKFSPEETIIYRITENRFRNNLNAFFKKGEASRNYGVFMVQLLRLRQCTSHPFMLERTIKESWTMEDVHELKMRLSKIASNAKPFYEQCELWVEQSEARRAELRGRGEVVPDDEMLPFGQSAYGHNFSMAKALKNLNEKELYKRVTCSICSDIPVDPMKTDCGHIFCRDCLDTFCHELVAQESDYMTCPECNRVFHKTEKVKRPGVGVSEDNSNDSHPSRASSANPKYRDKGKGKEKKKDNSSKGKDVLGFEPFAGDCSWVAKSDCDPDFPLAPSSKTTTLKALLLKGFEDAPLDKVVIYVQFRTLARIVGRICESEGWGFIYLTGDSSLEHRTKAIKKFRDDEDTKILIAGLKCGGLGLNFPWANRCISLDLWWNHAVEQQAFGRIFRIGQEKETYMTRIVVKNSVDMRMLSMQLHKLQTLEKAMRDGETKETPNLSLKQLANLFGFLKTDADDKIVSVEPDYDDEDDEESGGSGGASAGGEGGRNWGRDGDGGEEEFGWDNVGVDGYGNGNQGYGNVMDVDEDEGLDI